MFSFSAEHLFQFLPSLFHIGQLVFPNECSNNRLGDGSLNLIFFMAPYILFADILNYIPC